MNHVPQHSLLILPHVHLKKKDIKVKFLLSNTYLYVLVKGRVKKGGLPKQPPNLRKRTLVVAHSRTEFARALFLRKEGTLGTCFASAVATFAHAFFGVAVVNAIDDFDWRFGRDFENFDGGFERGFQDIYPL